MAWHRKGWTNADPIHWRIYAALGGNELNGTVVILMKVSSLAAPEASRTTTFSKNNDENFVKNYIYVSVFQVAI